MNYHQTDEFSSNWWNFIKLINFHHINDFHQSHPFWWKNQMRPTIFFTHTKPLMNFDFGLNDSFSKGKSFSFNHHNGWIGSVFPLILTYSYNQMWKSFSFNLNLNFGWAWPSVSSSSKSLMTVNSPSFRNTLASQ